MPFRPTLFLDADPTPGSPPAPPAPPERRVDEFLDRLIARHGTSEAALRTLAQQVYGYQDKTEADAREIRDLRSRMPEQGAVVLTGPQAQAWQTAVELKLDTPDALRSTVTDRDRLRGETREHIRASHAREAAQAAGLDADALADLARRSDLHLELADQTVTEHGRQVAKKVARVRPAKDEKAQLQPLSEYVRALPAFEQRALQAVATAPASQGTPYVAQSPTSAGATRPAADAVAAHLTASINNLPPGLLPARH